MNEVRREGSYIYEEFVETQGTDVKASLKRGLADLFLMRSGVSVWGIWGAR